MIKQESIERLLSVTDIVSVVERYVPLKKSGQNFVGVCPFHDDRNPSMSVSSQKGIFHCFSCKAGGNAIKFIMEFEKISYPEAIEKLASMTNFTLEYDNQQSAYKAPAKPILEILNSYYQSLLYGNKEALNYLYSRGLDDTTIQKFGLGWADDSQNTIRLLQNEEIEPNDALAMGAVKVGENGMYASFSHRITFPIKNQSGKIVGFGGRTISNHPAKYINSPQCAVFNKSRIFYAYDIAKQDALKKQELIITEGYMDVIMLHKAGINNAVAVLGTALTAEHLPLIRRGNFSVVLSFDGDSAGINAAIKSARLLSTNGIDSSVVIVPGGADPADMVVAGRVEELRRMYASGVESGEFLIRQIASNYDISRPIQKEKALEEIKNYTNELNPVVAGGYEDLVARVLKIAPGSFSLNGKNFTTNEGKNFKSQNFSPKKFNEKTINKDKFSRTKDIGELQILKTMIENVNFLNFGFDLCEEHDFKMHTNVFKILKNGDESDEAKEILREIALDDSIIVIQSEERFFMACKILRENYLQDKITQLRNSDDPDKLEKMFALRDELKKLKTKI